MSDRWVDRLSEYLDGELPVEEREELEGHLAVCAECGAVLDDLRRVVARASRLDDAPPESDLWPGIAERIGLSSEAEPVLALESFRRVRETPLARRRFTFSLPQLVAAGIALALVSAGSVWVALSVGRNGAGVEGTLAGGEATEVQAPATVLTTGGTSYDAAVAELEAVLTSARDKLDPATVAVIEENLMVIDRAIAQARRALVEDPSSAYLNEYLAATMRQKLDFLRQAAQLAGAIS